MSTLIKNGCILTAENEYQADIFIENEKISMIADSINLAADTVIDAKGKYVFPGGIDQHTHFDALCNSGDENTSGYEATGSVIAGGTTTIVDYAPQDPGCGLIDSIDRRINERAKGLIAVDFALHALVTEVSDKIFDELPLLAAHGVPSIKLFMAYKGSPLYVDDGTLYKTLQMSTEYGVTVFVHAENADIINLMQKQLVSEGKTEPKYHADSRPPFVEAEATQRAILLARAVNAPIHIVHVSCKEALDAIRDARSQNLPVFAESVTHHLVLTPRRIGAA